MKKNISNGLIELVAEKDWIIDQDLFKKYFGFKSLIDMQNNLYETRNTSKNKKLSNKK